MSSSIPYDPSLVLGHLVPEHKVQELKDVAEVEKPARLAERKMNNLKTSSYKMKMVLEEMENFDGVPLRTKIMLRAEYNRLNEEVADATVETVMETIQCQRELNKLLDKQEQHQISSSVESPLDFALSPIESYPLSSDTLNFDVQYFRNEGNKEDSSGHAAQIASFVSNKVQNTANSIGTGADASISQDVKANMTTQTTNHLTEGTIVIIAHCTHRASDIIAPVVLDPKKTVSAWNATFPRDKLKRNAVSMFDAALREDDRRIGRNILRLLSGCTRASSFVGFVHISKTERTETAQSSAALASGMKSIIQQNMALSQMSGQFGGSKALSQNLKNLMSTSQVENHCSLITRGIIPNISSNEVLTTVMSLKPQPSDIMAQQQAILASSETNINNNMESVSFETLGNTARNGAQYMELNSSYMKDSVSTIHGLTTEGNKVIDTNSMLTAFTNFIDLARKGKCGVPVNFFIKEITKREVAECYINKYFPNGASDGTLARMGQLGQEQKTDN